MKLYRIKAVLLQQMYINKRSLEVIMDLFFASFVTLFAVGFFDRFLVGVLPGPQARYILLGTLLFIIIAVAQYALAVNSMWNIWSRNLSNLFIAPLRMSEYLLAHMASGVVITAVLFIPCALIAWGLFSLNVFALGASNLLIIFLNLTIFGWTIGLIVLGVVFTFGKRLQALTWGLIWIFQPLTAVFFPVTVLPQPLQWLAWALPPTYTFEAAREALTSTVVNWGFAAIGFAENVVYFVLALWFFYFMWHRSEPKSPRGFMSISMCMLGVSNDSGRRGHHTQVSMVGPASFSSLQNSQAL